MTLVRVMTLITWEQKTLWLQTHIGCDSSALLVTILPHALPLSLKVLGLPRDAIICSAQSTQGSCVRHHVRCVPPGRRPSPTLLALMPLRRLCSGLRGCSGGPSALGHVCSSRGACCSLAGVPGGCIQAIRAGRKSPRGLLARGCASLGEQLRRGHTRAFWGAPVRLGSGIPLLFPRVPACVPRNCHAFSEVACDFLPHIQLQYEGHVDI